jgi:hypothetical protein
MAQVGRISGPLLQANLERQGKDLAFANNEDTTKLLYFDVNENRLGVNRGTATQTVDIAGTATTFTLLSSTATLGNTEFSNSTIESAVGDLFLGAQERVNIPAIDNGTIVINNNSIETAISNANINLVPANGGSVAVTNDVDVYGDIYTPGNIRLDGNLVFGDNQTQDTVTFNTEVNSDIIPDDSTPVSIGSAEKTWKDLYTRLVNGQQINAGAVDASGTEFTARQGNIIYVGLEGDDSNTGDHPQDPFRTLKRALDAADGSDLQPITILISSGIYEEQFPLVVPSYTTVTGADIRNTIIKPTAQTQYQDAFLLDGDTTVQNITVKDFYYDDNTGYAFRFRQNTIVKERSPYIQSVTVITKGSNTSNDDPRGFASRDAGGGAYVDGAAIDSSSESASMLFNGCTFITPGANALVMTNGVRVEWLSCFTYFAHRGLYAFNNSTGRVTEYGETKFGAELRSIASASVYGTFGAESDGDDCLMYLINHNFAYIGVDERTDNDNTLTNEDQETIETNNGRIFYTSIDHTGKYKVGDNFFVDFDSGITNLDVSAITADAFTTIRLEENGSQTLFDVNALRTGNIVFSGNRLQTVEGDLNIDSAVDINLNSDVDIEKDLSIKDNFSFGGSLNLLGDQPTDTVKFEVDVSQDFLPDKDLEYTLGSTLKEWAIIWLTQIHADGIDIQNNYVTTNRSNSDLELRANGSGKIFIPENFSVTNNLSQTGSVTVQNLVSDTVVLQGRLDLQGSYATQGNVVVSQNLSAPEDLSFEQIDILGNRITTTQPNQDLELKANQTGLVRIPYADTILENNITADFVSTSADIFIANTVSFSKANVFNQQIFTQPYIEDNYVETGYVVEPNNGSSTENITIIELEGNKITTNSRDLQISAARDVVFHDLKFDKDTLFTDTTDIEFFAKSNTIVDSIGSLELPKGIDGYTGSQAQIRFNTDDGVFEGFNSIARISFGGVYSDDRNSFLLVNDQNQIDFTTNEIFVGQIRTNLTEFINIDVDDINIDNNKIQTTLSNSNLEFQTNQTAGTALYDTRFQDSKIENTSTDGLTFSSTRLGYYKIDSSNGVVVPYSSEADRPSTAQVGETRWNTDTELLEVWNGNAWISAAGLEDTVTADEFDDLITEYTLIFG